MIKKRKLCVSALLLLVILFFTTIAGYAQGRGGPDALQNAFAGGPIKPPGGGNGDPIAVPLDTDALIFLLFAGIVYLLYHNRKLFTGDKNDEPIKINGDETLIAD